MADSSGVITSVEAQRRRSGRRCNVFVDGRYAFSVDARLAQTLHVGRPLSGVGAAMLLSDDQRARCREAAIRFLAVRPRSEREIRRRLDQHGYPSVLVEAVVESLRGLDLIDDTAFARYWVEQRQTHRPRGARLLKLELRRKGLDAEVAAEAVANMGDEGQSAYQAAAGRARILGGVDERTFRQRLGGFLQRRGFDYQSANWAVNRLWDERSGGSECALRCAFRR